jgi:hypothetical protein
VTDHRDIGDLSDDSVAVGALDPAARAVAATVTEQIAEHHRGIPVDGGVGDRHAEFDGCARSCGQQQQQATT